MRFVLFLSVGALLVSCSQNPTHEEAIREPAEIKAVEDTPGPNENERFAKLADRSEIAIRKLSARTRTGLRRGFHAKQHGCVKGRLVVTRSHDIRGNQGIFREIGREYAVWARFSNGLGFNQADRKPDLRGLALKVLDVDGKQLLPERNDQRTQDFVMFNSENSLFPTAEDAVVMLEEQAEGKFDLLKFAAQRPEFAGKMATKFLTPDLLKETYFNASPMRMGPYAGRLRISPCSTDFPTPNRPLRTNENYLRTRLIKSFETQSICMKVEAQFQNDPAVQTVEDGHQKWKTLYETIAIITFPQQQIDNSVREAFCTSLAFNPWNAIEEHRPLGETMRMRKLIYQRSAQMRNATPMEPTSADEIP